MITRDSIIKLADLGLVKQVKPIDGKKDLTLTMDMVAMGTPVYMPPEQALDEKKCGIRSDIYALGITLYHLLTGAPPFLALDQEELFKQHLTEIARPVSEINPVASRHLDLIISKCIMKKPEDRYQSPKELLTDLNLLKMGQPPKFATQQMEKSSLESNRLSGQKTTPTEVKLTATSPQVRQKRTKNKLLIFTLSVAIIAIITLNIFLIFQMSKPRNEAPIKTPANISNPPKTPKREENQIISTIDTPQPQKHITPAETARVEEKKIETQPQTEIISEDTPSPEQKLPEDFTRIITNLKQLPQIGRTLRQYPRLKGELFAIGNSNNWQECERRLMELIHENQLPDDLSDLIYSLAFASSFINNSSIKFTSKNSIFKSIDKESPYAVLTLKPESDFSQSPFLEGIIVNPNAYFELNQNPPLRIKIPFLYQPQFDSSQPLQFNLDIESIPPKSGLAIKFYACAKSHA